MLNSLIQPFLKKNKCFILAYDQGSNKNPDVFKFQSQNPTYIFELAKNIKATGIILNKGIAEIYSKSNYKTPLIIKLDSKSETTQQPILTCSVKYAKKLNAKAIGYTVHFGSKYESEQLEIFSELAEEAHELNMAAILWTYIVDDSWNHVQNISALSFALRQAYELGADLVKIPTIENISDIQKLNTLVPNLPIAIRGGDIMENNAFLEWTKKTIDNGASGLIVGRNIWQKENPTEIGNKIHSIVFKKN